jgi:hypothetical protein
MVKRKMRKFADGGFTAAQEEWLGGADRTDPYILARMRSAHPDEPMKALDDSPAGKTGYGEENEMPSNAPVTKTVTQKRVSVTKPKSTWEDDSKIPAFPDVPRKLETPAENKARMEDLTKKQALINVEPENYVPGIGMVKGLIKRGIKSLSNKGLKTYTADEIESMTPKIGREALKIGMKKGGSVKAMCGGGKAKKMSSGGKVKSASSRADGCAIRGKTRA